MSLGLIMWTVAWLSQSSLGMKSVVRTSRRNVMDSEPKNKQPVVRKVSISPNGGMLEVNNSADFDTYSVNGLAVEVQSLEKRVDAIENAVHAGNHSLQQATPATTITVMSIDHAFGTAGTYFNFDAPSGWTSHQAVDVKQCRNGQTIWSGRIMWWNNPNGGTSGNSHGRRDSGSSSGQWQVGDIVTDGICQSPTNAPTSAPTTLAPTRDPSSCYVTVYEHWPEGITAGISGLQAAELAWGGHFPTGASMVLHGTGDKPLGVLSNLTSSVKVEGPCCKAYGYTTTDCSGSQGSPIETTTQLLQGLPAGVVTPATGLASIWSCNDCAQCVKVVQECPTEAPTPAPTTQAPTLAPTTQAPTSSPTTQSPTASTYAAGDVGVDACPDGYYSIHTASECEIASNALGYTYEAGENTDIGTSDSLCNYCGGCNPKTTRVDATHGTQAKWICSTR